MDQAIPAPNPKVELYRTWLKQKHIANARRAIALHHAIGHKHRGEARRRPPAQRIAFGRLRDRRTSTSDQPDAVKPARRIAAMKAKAGADERTGATDNVTGHSASANHCRANAAPRENWRRW